MNKETLKNAVEACKAETKEALQTVFDELNNGQQNKLLRNQKIKDLFNRYQVEYKG